MTDLLILRCSSYDGRTRILYPVTCNDNMRPFHNINQPKKYFEKEAIQSSMKIAKYAFSDIVKELVAMKIEPSIRPLFKCVFDGSVAKYISSFYGIMMFSLTEVADARYYYLLCIAYQTSQ